MASNSAIVHRLDVALYGILRRPALVPPKYGTYVTAEGHGFNLFTRELQLAVRNKLFFKLLQAHQQRRSCASVSCSLENHVLLLAQPGILECRPRVTGTSYGPQRDKKTVAHPMG